MGNLIESEESKTNQLEEILQSYRILKDKSNKDCVIYENMYNQRIKVEMRSYHYTN